jgi:response regulator NasT
MAEARILIAEDTEIIATALEDQLNGLGYEVTGIARSGEEAVRLCEQQRPDLLILDMQIAGLAGDAVAGRIRERTPTPIIMLSGASDADSIDKARQAGALAYLVKPIKPEELPPAIDIALARHRELRRLREHVDELHDTLESRKVIERAVGILMKRLNISKQAAEERLRQRANDKGVPVKEMAQAIVDSDALLS